MPSLFGALKQRLPHSKQSPPQSGSSEASQRVFGIVELLEHILSSLSTTELARSRQVCVDWQALVLSSPKLQRKLFLRPAPRKDFLVYRTSDWTTLLCYAAELLDKPKDWLDFPIVALNPALQADIDHDRRNHHLVVVDWVEFTTILSRLQRAGGPPDSSDKIKTGLRIGEMFVTQPPIKQLHLGSVGSRMLSETIECEAGVKFSHLTAWASRIREDPQSPLYRTKLGELELRVSISGCIEEHSLQVAIAKGECVLRNGRWERIVEDPQVIEHTSRPRRLLTWLRAVRRRVHGKDQLSKS